MGEWSMASDTEISRFVHQANIVKYEKILATYLMHHERLFIERRLAEEKAELQRLPWYATSEEQPAYVA
jgi:hypothetical protein